MPNEPSNQEILDAVTTMQRQVDTLIRSLPVLAKLTGDQELRRLEQEKARKLKAAAGRVARGRGR